MILPMHHSMPIIDKNELEEQITKVKLEYQNLNISYIKKDILIDSILPVIKGVLEKEKEY